MAKDMFIKFTGIDGESQDDKHAGEIDVLSWSWGVSQSGTMHQGGGGGAGKASFNDFSFTKYIDRASPPLLRVCATGEHITEALFTVRKAGAEAQEYLKYKFTDCLITAMSTGGSGGEDRFTENVTVNFAEFRVEYKPQKKDGTLDGAVPFAYSIEKSKKL